MPLLVAALLAAAPASGPAAELNARLLAARSATAVLEQWCGEHHFADPARVHAELVPGARHRLTSTQRRQLGIGRSEPVGYRRVRLVCGGHVMSEAENWYVPARLTPEMNHALETSDTPFGTAIRPLAPSRRTLGVDWLHGRKLFRHRALVLDRDGQPLAEVVETYMAGALR